MLVKLTDWKDVRDKASRLRSTGSVFDLSYGEDIITAKVRGDSGTYDVELYRQNPTDKTVTFWSCSCFPPGTMVTMSDGTLKPIEEIQEGEYVRTGQGNSKRVLRTMSKEYDGTVYGVRLTGDHEVERIWATEEHPWFRGRVVQDRECPKCTSWARYNGRCTHKVESEYVESRNLRVGDHLQVVTPQVDSQSVELDMSEYLEDFEDVGNGLIRSACTITETRSPQAQKKTKHTQRFRDGSTREVERIISAKEGYTRTYRRVAGQAVPRFVKLDSDLAYVIGFFIGDGSYNNDDELNFSLNRETEGSLADHLVEIIREKFGVTVSKVDTKDGCWTVRVHSNIVARLFRHLVGVGTRNKRLSFELRSLPLKETEYLIWGLVDSDGCTQSPTSACITGINREMLEQVREQLGRLGWPSSWEYNTLEQQQRAIAGSKSGCWRLQFLHHQVSTQSKKFSDDSGIWREIHSVESEKYQGLVYNLEVEGDHTYCPRGVHVHNCPWGKWAFKRQETYVGRFCSHVLATYWEVQSQDVLRVMNPDQYAASSSGPWTLAPLLRKANARGVVSSDQDFSDSVMIAAVPAHPDEIARPGDSAVESEELHCTMVYLGPVANYTQENRVQALDFLREMTANASPFGAEVTEVAPLGKDNQTVLHLDCPELVRFREAILEGLEELFPLGPEAYKFPEYKPHISLDWDGELLEKVQAVHPESVDLTGILVSWGDKDTYFFLEDTMSTSSRHHVLGDKNREFDLGPLEKFKVEAEDHSPLTWEVGQDDEMIGRQGTEALVVVDKDYSDGTWSWHTTGNRYGGGSGKYLPSKDEAISEAEAWFWGVTSGPYGIESRTAGKHFSIEEQEELIFEEGDARNLHLLDLDGTMYVTDGDGFFL